MKTEIETIEIKTLSKFILEIKNFHILGFKIFFRGQNTDAPLLPKIFRNPILKCGELIDIEKKILQEFKMKARSLLDEKPDNENNLEWLAIAQHHGLKTRLLDWTENALAALWFCVRKKPQNFKNNGVIWKLGINELLINYANENDCEEPFNITETKIYRPPYISKRIVAQSGIFTLHKYHENDFKIIPLNEDRKYIEKLQKIIIPYNSFDEIKKDLENCGIHAASLFTDLDGLCELLNDIPSSKEKMELILNMFRSSNNKK